MIIQMQYHGGSCDWIRKERETMSSKLGFGLMRLPRLADGGIDIAQCSEMVDHFLKTNVVLPGDIQERHDYYHTAMFKRG